MNNKNITIASDHAGYDLKNYLVKEIINMGFKVIDLGTNSNDSVDYPDFAKMAVKNILEKKSDVAVLICGSGIGMSMTANRFKGIRAALCRDVNDAKLARQHNNANILTLPGRQIDVDEAKNCFKIFINTSFEGGRHKKRVEKID
ncbi:MAG: Ribose-5-phosphate isomerase B [Alphaproteobacteria bacterium MarineAlpha6_Bin6]|nr:ribose 5-phosphate isomerase B [Pelagibacteraceae bacterium]PPR29649.1 MAG: Ribose-5-phosphate isomerase B [Alphaproteobacteria bacterium MarineAlpha6_Bin6]PPR33258.1 MAG: Ribose-5-phosphate isomerase B [Alphaproteobacteria bacterium MarineAlpha6_Bin5]|tara:strand:+ start:1383 stop:1817 length:435 start_codon:yes stop_codon:yes gene_type:complete